MKQYKITAQFAKAGAPSFHTSGYAEYLNEAREFFDMKSRVATNPKKILNLTIVDDETIEIVLQSENELNISQVSRSLRIFSTYLCDATHAINFAHLKSGNRLFRMKAMELPEIKNTENEMDEEGMEEPKRENEEEEKKENRVSLFQHSGKEEIIKDMILALALLLKEEDKTPKNAANIAEIKWILEEFISRRDGNLQ